MAADAVPAIEVRHDSDDGLTALCGESLAIDRPIGPGCPACEDKAGRTRYVWPTVSPAVLGLIWLAAVCVGRQVTLWDFGVPQRMAAVAVSTVVLLGVVALTGRVRPDKGGGE